jgi:hypothetical protein
MIVDGKKVEIAELEALLKKTLTAIEKKAVKERLAIEKLKMKPQPPALQAFLDFCG